MQQLKNGKYMFFWSFFLEILNKKPIFKVLVVLQKRFFHEKISNCQHAVEMASGKMSLKPTMIDFRAIILRLASKNLLIIKLNSRDHFNKEVNCHLNPLLVIFNLLGDFVEEEFEVLLVVEILDDQTDHMIQQM